MVAVCAQQPAPARACRFYAGEMVMSMLALTAALYGVAAANKWSFSIFLTLQGDLSTLAIHISPDSISLS